MVTRHPGEILPAEPAVQGGLDESERLVHAWFAAWNRADREALRALVHVPHVAVQGPWLVIRDTEHALQSGPDFRSLQAMEGWHHTTLDRLEVSQRSEDKVHCVATFGRTAADGQRYADGEAVYVVTRRSGRWAIQLNTGTLTPLGLGGGDSAAAVAAARSVLMRWLRANEVAGAASTAHRLVHLPFVELDGPEVLVRRTPEEVCRAAIERASCCGWERSALRRVAVRERSSQKVTLDVEIARMTPGGSLLTCDAALCVLAERDGRWAMQVHSGF